MSEILKKMNILMPLELWGIVFGLIISYLLLICFLMFIDWLSDITKKQ